VRRFAEDPVGVEFRDDNWIFPSGRVDGFAITRHLRILFKWLKFPAKSTTLGLNPHAPMPWGQVPLWAQEVGPLRMFGLFKFDNER
jgi:hypothetical protein